MYAGVPATRAHRRPAATDHSHHPRATPRCPIQHVHLAELADHDVVRLHVAMHDSAAMRKTERIGDLNQGPKMPIQNVLGPEPTPHLVGIPQQLGPSCPRACVELGRARHRRFFRSCALLHGLLEARREARIRARAHVGIGVAARSRTTRQADTCWIPAGWAGIGANDDHDERLHAPASLAHHAALAARPQPSPLH